MLQHLFVLLSFVACLYMMVRRIVRFLSSVGNDDAHCDACNETSCPLRELYAAKKDSCGCGQKDIKCGLSTNQERNSATCCK